MLALPDDKVAAGMLPALQELFARAAATAADNGMAPALSQLLVRATTRDTHGPRPHTAHAHDAAPIFARAGGAVHIARRCLHRHATPGALTRHAASFPQVDGFDPDQLWEELKLVNDPVLAELEKKLPTLAVGARDKLQQVRDAAARGGSVLRSRRTRGASCSHVDPAPSLAGRRELQRV